MNHKRKRPKHLRSGCLRCKAWKDERAAKGDRIKASLRRKLQDIASQMDTVRLDSVSERVLRDNLWELYG